MSNPWLDRAIAEAFNNGVVQGRQEGAAVGIGNIVERLRAEFDQKLNRTAGGLRRSLTDKQSHIDQKLGELQAVMNSVSIEKVGNGGVSPGNAHPGEGAQNILKGAWAGCKPGMIRIQDIPGSRTPYTLLLEIPISRDDMGSREQSYTITQEGPFVAVSRMAVFLSAHQFETTDPETDDIAQFSSRSFGRFRPVSSAWDLMDAQHNAIADTATWWLSALANPGAPPGTALPQATLGLASSMASFRTMEFDGRIDVKIEGSGKPRQNLEVPSAFWSTSINAPWDLGCLDFFERGESITIRVRPTHVNNPPAGNIDGAAVFPAVGTGGWPFLEGQFDAHEGIATPGNAIIGSDNPLLPDLLQNDSVSRLPDGILIIGYEGYRINQPIGIAL